MYYIVFAYIKCPVRTQYGSNCFCFFQAPRGRFVIPSLFPALSCTGGTRAGTLSEFTPCVAIVGFGCLGEPSPTLQVSMPSL